MKALPIALFAGMFGCALIQPMSAAGAATYKEKVLYSFCARWHCTDGGNPRGSLIDVSGTLYGTTEQGGRTCFGDISCGTVFAIDPGTGTERVLYSFCGQENCADGARPIGGLIEVNGILYGTTSVGGNTDPGCATFGCGTVFSLDPSTGTETVLYSFCSKQNCTDGANPEASLIDVNGKLYGTTTFGGSNGYGTVFALDPNAGNETVLYSFCSQLHCTDGANPLGSLIDVNGILYGTANRGGTRGCDFGEGCGTVFSVDPMTGAETVLHTFCSQTCADGRSPYAGLLSVRGRLYGTTEKGGGTGCGEGCGTVYSINPTTGREKVLYSFSGGADGAAPLAALIDVKGTLYGVTNNGGGAGCYGSGCGTVFSIDRKTGAETVLYTFCSEQDCANGVGPVGLIAVNGKLYGTTNGGGTGCGCGGTVFMLKKKR